MTLALNGGTARCTSSVARIPLLLQCCQSNSASNRLFGQYTTCSKCRLQAALPMVIEQSPISHSGQSNTAAGSNASSPQRETMSSPFEAAGRPDSDASTPRPTPPQLRTHRDQARQQDEEVSSPTRIYVGERSTDGRVLGRVSSGIAVDISTAAVSGRRVRYCASSCSVILPLRLHLQVVSFR